MNFIRCKECKEHHFDNEPCKPVYQVFHEEYNGDDAYIYRADSMQEAAQKYAMYYNQDDYSLMNESIKVKVQAPNGDIKWFELSSEPSVYYHIYECYPPE